MILVARWFQTLIDDLLVSVSPLCVFAVKISPNILGPSRSSAFRLNTGRLSISLSGKIIGLKHDIFLINMQRKILKIRNPKDDHHSRRSAFRKKKSLSSQRSSICALVNFHITVKNHHVFHGNIHYFYGHGFHSCVNLPEGMAMVRLIYG